MPKNPDAKAFKAEVAAGERFRFGENWQRFLTSVDENRIQAAMASLAKMLHGTEAIKDGRFLDVGQGSGIFSLAAVRMGARSVFSFDYDPQSVECALEMKRRYAHDADQWQIERGSVLDTTYLGRLQTWDVVYSWGVLHHTGSMWIALENTAHLVKPGGNLFIAIYNDQGWISRYWLAVKRLYNTNPILKIAVILFHLPYLYGLRIIVRFLTGRLKIARGMSLWHDMLDWLGGYPFEVAKPEEISEFYRSRGFTLVELRTVRKRNGCNEFVFRKQAENTPPDVIETVRAPST